MPSDIMHLEQAKHNHRLAKRLTTESDARDWCIIVTFYAAVHYIESCLKKNHNFDSSKGPGSPHTNRKHKVYDLLRTVYPQYKKLNDLSMMLRYLHFDGVDAKSSAGGWLEDIEVKKIVNKDLLHIASEISAKIGAVVDASLSTPST